MKSCWKNYRGRQILYSDYGGLGADVETLAREVADSERFSFSQPDGSILNLVNVEGSVGTPEGVEMLKKSAIDTKRKTKRIAVLGVTGLKQFLAQGIARISGQDIRYFDTEAEALDWLVQEE
jgi:hypothetical protein